MPIKDIKPRLAALGNIKIGRNVPTKGGKTRPAKIDHFLVTSLVRDDNNNFEVDKPLMGRLVRMQRDRVIQQMHTDYANQTIFRPNITERESKALKKKIKERHEIALHEEKLRTIEVMLPFDDENDNLVSNYALYDGRGCRCRGEGGNEAAEFIDPKTGEVKVVDSCPCELLQIYTPTTHHPYIDPQSLGNRSCKPHGILRCMIIGAKTLGGVHIFRTTSWHSITQLLASMEQIKQITGGMLSYLPLQLSVRPRHVQVRLQNGSQSYQKVYVVDLTYPEGLKEFLQEASQLTSQRTTLQSQINAPDRAALPAPGYEEPEEQKAVAAEFYPDDETVDVKAEEVEKDPPPESRESSEKPDEPASSATPEGKERPPQENEPEEHTPEEPPEGNETSDTTEEPSGYEPYEPYPSDVCGSPYDDGGPGEGPHDEPPSDSEKEFFPTVAPKSEKATDAMASKEDRKRLILTGRKARYSDADIRRWMNELWEVESTAALKQWQIDNMLAALNQRIEEANNG